MSFDVAAKNDAYHQIEVALTAAKSQLDSIPKNEFKSLMSAIDLYSNLKKILRARFNMTIATNATLKIYEITCQMKLFLCDDNSFTDRVRSFHNAELPGAFISAINHYIRTKAPHINFSWLASSYYPMTSKTVDMLGDHFGLYANNRGNWLQGPKPNAIPTSGPTSICGDLTTVEDIVVIANSVHKLFARLRVNTTADAADVDAANTTADTAVADSADADTDADADADDADDADAADVADDAADVADDAADVADDADAAYVADDAADADDAYAVDAADADDADDAYDADAANATAAADDTNSWTGATLYTSDAGTDVSTDYNRQEHATALLNFGQVICGLSSLTLGGDFVVKQYTFLTPFSRSLLILTSSHFDKFSIVKPLSSKPTNSEVYVVGRGFRGINHKLLKELFNRLKYYQMNPDMSPCDGPPLLDLSLCAISDAELTIAARQVHGQQQVAFLNEAASLYKQYRDRHGDLVRDLRTEYTRACDAWLRSNPVHTLHAERHVASKVGVLNTATRKRV